jgi:hypothetical protein
MLDKVAHLRRRRGVDPQLDAVIDVEPFGVTESERRVVGQAKLTIGYLEEGAPLLVVGLGEVQRVWHMFTDVDDLRCGSGGRSRRSFRG